jgi:hypothetical protein
VYTWALVSCVIKQIYFHIVSGTVIVPETPGPSCVKPKSVLTVAESPCSESDTDSSFSVTSAGKSDKVVGKDKELKNHPEWKQDISDDSIYEAETQCDVDCLDVSEHSSSKSHSSNVSHEGKICASALDQEEEDIFEAETQCEEPSFKGPVKLFSPSGQKKQDLVLTKESVCTVDDICEIKMQGELDDGLSETVQHDAVSNENLVPKSFEQDHVKACNINQKCKVDRVTAKDVDNMSNKHDDKIYGASTRCLLGHADVTTSMGERGAVGVGSQQTKDCGHDGGSLNSQVNVKDSLQGKVDITDSNILIKRKAIDSGSEMAGVPSSNINVQQKVQLDRPCEKISCTVTKIPLDVSCNEDSCDRSLLEGDDEFFISPATQTSESKDAASKTSENSSEVCQEGSKNKSNCTNSDDTETDVLSVSKMCTVRQSISEKTPSASAAFKNFTANKVSSVQAKNHSGKESDIIQPETMLMKSLSCNNKEAAKLCDESGDETDPDDIFDASTQIILPPVSNRKVISNLSETSVTIHSDRIKPATQSSSDHGNGECKNKVTEKQSKGVESQKKNSSEFLKSRGSLKEDSVPAVSNVSVVVGTEKEKTPTQISTEFEDSDDDIYDAPTQVLFTPNKHRNLTKLPVSSREETTDIPKVMSSRRMKVPGQLNCASGDYDNDDSVFEAATQILETTTNKDLTKPLTSSSVEQKKNALHDYDDDSIFEAATQILETACSKDLTKPVTSSSVEQKKNASHDYDDDNIFDAATQILETTSSKDLTKPVNSPVEQKKNAAHDYDDDSIFEAATQILESTSHKDLTSSPVEQKKDTAHDYDDNSIFEAATQILETPNRSGREFSKVFSPSPMEEHINADRDDSDTVSEAATQIVETRNRTGGGFINASGISSEKDTVSIPTPSDNHKGENLSSSSGSEGHMDLGDKAHVTDMHSVSAQRVNYTDNKTIEFKESCASVQEPVTAELKKLDGDVAHAQRRGDEKHELVVTRKSNVTLLPSRKSGVVKHGIAESAHHNTACAQKLGIKEARESHDTTVRTRRRGAGKRGMEESKKQFASKAESKKPSDRISRVEEAKQYNKTASDCSYFSGEPMISRSEKSRDLLVAQKEDGGKPEVEGSTIPGDTKSSLCDDPDEAKDPKHFFEANSQTVKVKKNADDKFNIGQKTDLPNASGETAQTGGKNDVICTCSTSLAPIQNAFPLSIGHTEDQNKLTLIRCTKSTTADVSCGNKEANAVTLAVDNVNSDNLLKVPPSKCDTVTTETIGASMHTSKMSLKSEKFIGQPIDISKNLVSNELASSATSTTVKSLLQNQGTENREQKLNSDLQECMPTDHSEEVDESQKLSVGITEVALDSKRLEPENSSIQNENDFKSYSDISQQVCPEYHRTISEEHGRVLDVTDAPICDSLNDTAKPSSQDGGSEAKASPFKAEEVILTEDEEHMPTIKLIRHSHLPNKRAKDRKRLQIESQNSSTAAGASGRRLSDEGSTDVSIMSKTAAGISRTRRRRRRELHNEDCVQSDTSDIQASKYRKFTQKDSARNDSKNMSSDIISLYSASGCAGEIQKSGSEVEVCSDKESHGKGRKSKAATTKNREQDKTVASVKWSGEAKGGRLSEEVTEPGKDNASKVTRNKKEHSVNTNEDVENAVARNTRPSRQRKMTWKVRDSIGTDSSQGSISLVEEGQKKRSRGSSSHNSESVMNESRECSAGTTTRSRSPTKSPSKKLLKSSEGSGSDTLKEVKKTKQNNFFTPEQTQRKSMRQSKVHNAVTSTSDMSKDQSSQRITRQNNRKVVSNNLQKKKNEETVTEISSKHSKMEDKVFPDEKFQRNSTDKCSPKSFKDVSSGSSTKVSGRKRRQTANIEFVQEQSTDITLSTEVRKLEPVLEKASCFIIGSVRECTGRSVRRRTEVTNASLSYLKEETGSVSLHRSSRTQQGVKRTILSTEGDERLPAKHVKTEKRLTQPHSSSESDIQSNIVEAVPLSRTSRTRSRVTSPQKLDTAGTVRQDTQHCEREKASQISKTEEANKKLKSEPLTPRSCVINSSESQDMTPKRTSRRATPQSGFQKVSVNITSMC